MELSDLAHLVDQFGAVRQARLAADKVAATLKKDETALKERVLHEMMEHDVKQIGGTEISVKHKKTEKPKAEDWALVYKFMVDNNAMDLLQKRLGEAAVNARFEDGIKIPGIVFYEHNDLSVSKL